MPDLDTLEDMVDASSLAEVVQRLVDVCYAKAEHLRTSWQDEQAAKRWDRDALKLLRLSDNLNN